MADVRGIGIVQDMEEDTDLVLKELIIPADRQNKTQIDMHDQRGCIMQINIHLHVPE